jgi:homopolymeric O-antigen transport system permease protein
VSIQEAELRPPSSWRLVGVWELLRALVTKELKVKYKRSMLGFFWSLLTPIALTGIYLFVFIYVYKVPKQHFILFLLSGLLPWNYFNMSILAATTSIIDNGSAVRKVSFPRVLLPMSTVVANLINYSMGLLVLTAVMVLAGRPVWLRLHWLLLAVILETMLCFGVAMILSIGNVYFRDIQQLISILTLVLFFGTPVVYQLSQVPSGFRPFILANPLSAIMEMYRAAFFESGPPGARLLALACAETLALFVAGYLLFRKIAPNLAKEV